MTDDLLAYLLDDLPPQRRQEVELKIQSDPQWRSEYERLRECFDESQQELDADCVDQPPADLAQRTCQLVDSGHFAALGACGGAAMSDVPEGTASRRSRWSMADLTIAAGVLLVLFGLFSPALLGSRESSRQQLCNHNLRGVATLCLERAELQGGHVPPVQPDEPMGKLAWSLTGGSGKSFENSYSRFFCPNSPLANALADGKIKLRIVNWPEVSDADGESRKFVVHFLSDMYAFQSGHLDKRGSIRPVRLTLSTFKPLASHAPIITRDGAVQPNPSGCGGRMVFEDCHVGLYSPVGPLAGDDPFLNDNGEHAASDRENDVILLRGNVTPIGVRREFRSVPERQRSLLDASNDMKPSAQLWP